MKKIIILAFITQSIFNISIANPIDINKACNIATN